MLPDTLILDCSQELKNFKAALVSGLDMPTLVDFDATIEQVFSSVVLLDEYDKEVHLVALQVTEDVDSLFDNWHVEDDGRDRLYDAVKKMSNTIKNKLLSLDAYRNGQLPYTFRKILDADSVVISKVPSVSSTYEPKF